MAFQKRVSPALRHNKITSAEIAAPVGANLVPISITRRTKIYVFHHFDDYRDFVLHNFFQISLLTNSPKFSTI